VIVLLFAVCTVLWVVKPVVVKADKSTKVVRLKGLKNFVNLRLAILIQSSDSIYVKNTDKSSVSAVFSGSGIQIECV
jgi:hypothetical protein